MALKKLSKKNTKSLKKKVINNLKTGKSMRRKTMRCKSLTRKLNTINRNKSKRKGGANGKETIDSLRLSNEDDEIKIRLTTETGVQEMVVGNPNDNVYEAIREETGMKDIKVMFGDYELTNNEDTFRGVGIEDGATLMVFNALKQKNLTVIVRCNCFNNAALGLVGSSIPYDVDDSQEIEQTLRDEMDIPNNIPIDILIGNEEPINEHSTFADYTNYIEEFDDFIAQQGLSALEPLINREMIINVTTPDDWSCF